MFIVFEDAYRQTFAYLHAKYPVPSRSVKVVAEQIDINDFLRVYLEPSYQHPVLHSGVQTYTWQILSCHLLWKVVVHGDLCQLILYVVWMDMDSDTERSVVASLNSFLLLLDILPSDKKS